MAEPPRPVGAAAPTPVRTSLGEGPSAGEAEGPPEARALALEGAEWTVRAAGRAVTGAPGASAPLLHLEFRPPEGAGDPPREALVVGHDLADLPGPALEEAFARAVVRATPWERRPLFAHLKDRRGRS